MGGCINFLSDGQGSTQTLRKPGFPKECDVPTSCISGGVVMFTMRALEHIMCVDIYKRRLAGRASRVMWVMVPQPYVLRHSCGEQSSPKLLLRSTIFGYFHASPGTDLNLKAKGVVGGCINFLSSGKGSTQTLRKTRFSKRM